MSDFKPAPTRAIVLTFDNLGEASALERGTWNPGIPLGSDPSVTEALPRLLDALDAGGLTATFFVEAANCELNPLAVREIAARGHQLGVHGWLHEHWAQLGPQDERGLLERSLAAFAALGLSPRAFRPPGGTLTASTAALLRQLGFAWCSPEGGSPRIQEGLAFVPFSWDLVDAYHLMPRFGDLRAGRGDDSAPAPPEVVGDRLAVALESGDGVQTLILHPFLMLDDAWWAQARRLLALLAELDRDGRASVVPALRCSDF
jgi:peptidoglycan/xylan/chitin deacetylase (PgdA/CDA1 family)